MQPGQTFQQWLHQNEPGLALFLYLSIIGVCLAIGLALNWFSKRTSEPLSRPICFWLLIGGGTLAGATCGWILFDADLPALVGGRMLLLGFAGLVVGAVAGLAVQSPRTAAIGAGGGLTAWWLWAALDYWLRVRWGHDPWSAEAWETRSVFAILLSTLGAVLTVSVARTRPQEQERSSA